MSFVYLNCLDVVRTTQFDTLAQFTDFVQNPWLLVGDWNSYLSLEDKQGRRPVSQSQTRELGQLVNTTCLSEIPLIGFPYTWNNRQIGPNRIEAKLDRFFSNTDWFSLYPRAVVRSEFLASSDHRAIILYTDDFKPSNKRPLRFEALWDLQRALKFWNKNCVGNIFRRIEEIHGILSTLYQVPPTLRDDAWFLTEKHHIATLRKLNHQEELLWQQKSRSNWYVHGDRNTKFFHLTTVKRRARNVIKAINAGGLTLTEEVDIGREFLRVYKDIFLSQHLPNATEYLVPISNRVST
ncbi:uncharacterized protein LOC122665789 [Telopea speciosissima]|uniref:uncharacterized protein LOC122665789 n=1 Tax=Telopea speciosissima TaxID=54955 RepID=UPI001CC56612|nr:uncharacterized protein LOC122665789 [Telopea speciosissima]